MERMYQLSLLQYKIIQYKIIAIYVHLLRGKKHFLLTFSKNNNKIYKDTRYSILGFFLLFLDKRRKKNQDVMSTEKVN